MMKWLQGVGVAAVVAVLLGGLWLAWSHRPSRELGASFRYDLAEFRKPDPKLMIGREMKSFAAQVDSPHALAVDRTNRIYVGGDKGISVLEPGGHQVGVIPVSSPVTALAVGPTGTLYVGQTGHLAVMGPDGMKQADWILPGTNGFITSIAVTGSRVFVADAGQRLVWQYDVEGRIVGHFGEKDRARGFPGFFIPSPYFDLGIAPDGALWVVDPGRHRFIHFSPEGEVIGSWERTGMDWEGFCGCCNPSHFAIRADGSFVTSEKSIVRVKIHAVTGALVGVLAGPDQFAAETRGMDLAVDGNGRILVLDPVKGLIHIFVVEGS